MRDMKIRQAVVSVVTCFGLLGGMGASGCGDAAEDSSGAPVSSEPEAAAPAYPQWLRQVDRGDRSSFQVPLIALNCPVGNGFRCDRVVFVYTLALPAKDLDVWVAGRPVEGLRTGPYGEDGPGKGETGRGWTGFVQPAGLTEPGAPLEIPSTPATRRNYWAGVPPVRARVMVVAHLKSGETVRELFPFVNLQAGYG